MIEAGVVAGYVIAWAVRKARRAAGRLDAEADAIVDAGLKRLHTAVAAKLGAHPALEELAEEAATDEGRVSELTRQQVELAVTAAARKDDEFGQAVTELVAQLQVAEKASGASVVAGAESSVFTGDAHVHASGNAIGFGQVGGHVRVDRGVPNEERPGPSEPGRSHP
ncbi:hypothetical protein ACIRP3_42115 [Streptomyces sp. NPDC101209]|uniref:hypothetical protein n=1 Tax=Streptomyces sp. NPDC101209 TaxID=3366129 RepID=UPI00381E162E